MILLDLLWGFLRVGCFAFGGGYAAIPLIRELVLANGWMSDETLTYLIAVSESTPGPIMVNLSTYVGSTQAGLAGAMVATTAAVLPSFVITLLIMVLLKKALANAYVQAALDGLKPCIIGIILATGLYLLADNCLDFSATFYIDLRALLITALVAVLSLVWRKLRRRAISPILLIVISAGFGIVVYGI